MYHAVDRREELTIPGELDARARAYTVQGSGIGDYGGGWVEQPRRWLGSQWLRLTLGVPSCPKAARRALRRHKGARAS